MDSRRSKRALENSFHPASLLRIIAASEDPPVMVRILTHLGLPPGPRRTQARPLTLYPGGTTLGA
jgi:hypothetical protein